MNQESEFDWETERGRVTPGNFTDRAGAAELKARIEAYWAERGFDVQVMLIEQPFVAALRTARFDVRSEMIDGLPRSCRKRGSENTHN